MCLLLTCLCSVANHYQKRDEVLTLSPVSLDNFLPAGDAELGVEEEDLAEDERLSLDGLTLSAVISLGKTTPKSF